MTLNKRDSVWMKLFVAGLALLTTLKTLQSLMIMWIQNVTMFGDLEAGSNLWRKHWVWKTIQILEAATAFYVQMFFGRRLWLIRWHRQYLGTHILSSSVSLYFCAGLFPASLGYAPSGFILLALSSAKKIVNILTSTMESSTRWVGPHLAFVLCGDLLLTGSTIFCLLSAAPAALCALINFLAVMGMNTATWTLAPLLLDFFTNMVLPQLYAWSAMWTLNSREEICMDAGNSAYTIHLLETSAGSSNSETPRHQHQDQPGLLAKGQNDQSNGPPGSMA
ncbi:hypothetical protein B0H14DRAFT_2658317 [Mycena olivaceomarginata]|nr:hypothetical protein B0H14DRAFT_2658317 [Mycena olivaceomarginata]